MICKSPILITKPNQAQGGEYQKLSVPCGKCGQCLNTKRGEWIFRLKQELKSASSAHFLTLTYRRGDVPITIKGYKTITKSDLQLFIKRLRNYQTRKTRSEKTIRYYAIGEYGTHTHRPHYHAILFNCHNNTLSAILDIWTEGNVQIRPISDGRIIYITKDIINRYNMNLLPLGVNPSFALMSRNPGLGLDYVEQAKTYHQKSQNNYVYVNGGKKGRMPRIYKDKIFSINEKYEFYKQAMALQNESITKKLGDYDHYENPAQYFADQKQHTHNTILKNSKKSQL